MKIPRWCFLFVLLFLCLPIFAQETEDEAAKERQRRREVLINSIVTDARELKLSENRALALARAGTLLWNDDAKRAQQLFDESITELLAAQAEAETARGPARQNEINSVQSTRHNMFQIIGQRNAEFALKNLYRTRLPAVEQALAGKTAKDNKIRNSPGSDLAQAQNELNLEHQLMRQAAEQSPERAIALLQAALKKGVSGESLNLLRKLHEKDPAAAAEIGSEVISQLLRKSFTQGSTLDHNALYTSSSFIGESTRQRSGPADKSFRFAAGDIRSLLDKVIGFLTSSQNQQGMHYIQQIMPAVEKLRPDAVEKLRQFEGLASRNGFRAYVDVEGSRLSAPDVPIETILAEAPKLPAESRRGVYHNLANRLAAAGEVGRARQILSENFADDALDNAQESLNFYYAHQLTNQGKFNEAEALIDDFPESNRLAALISLASGIFNRNPAENKGRAMTVLEKARALLPERPENADQMRLMMQLIGVYAQVEGAEGFRMMEGLVQQINELAEASVVVNGFNSGSYGIRRGEMLISNGGGGGPYVDASVMRVLAGKDFDRTLALINSFSRREMRLSMKQYLIETL